MNDMQTMRGSPTLEYDGQINDHPDQRAEYPRMMYRKTDNEALEIQTAASSKGGETSIVTNAYNGLLCDTRTVYDADEAEELSADGWEISPRAAHGLTDGIAKAATAKDQRIAELERQIAERDAASAGGEAQVDADPIRRGPGRPPNLNKPA